MTTSFAWFVRGNIVASFYVQPMGTVLATLASMTVWAGGYVGVTGRPAYRLLWLVPTRHYVMPLLYFCFGMGMEDCDSRPRVRRMVGRIEGTR